MGRVHGSLPDSPTMGFLGYLSLVALLACGIQGASLPYKNGYQLHLNQKGVIMDLEMKDVNPLVGGKAHVELPISSVWKMLEVDAHLLKPIINNLEKTTLPVWKLVDVEAPFLKPIIIALEKNTLGRIYDVMTVKADMTFNAEEILKGIFNVAVEYTLVHKDGTEEKATLLIQGKNESGKLVTSMEIIPKNSAVMPEKKIFLPLEMIFTCKWPSAHTLTIKGDFGKIFLNIANNMNEVSVRGVLEYLGQQYKYFTILSIKDKMFTVTLQEPSKELYDVLMKVKMLNGFPMLDITGNIPTFQYFTAGDFKTEVIVYSWLNYEIKHTFHGVEMLRLTFGMLNGFPRMEITGKMPTIKYFTAGDFKTEVIVNSWFNYEIKHTFNGVEMLRLTFQMLNGFPMIEITGNLPTTALFTAGVFKSQLIVKSLYNYEIKHVFKGIEMFNLNIALINGKMEMMMKYGQTHKTHIVLEYEFLRWIKILLPTTNTWLSKDLGVEMHYQPTNEGKKLEGGNIKIVVKRDRKPIMNIGGYYGLTLDSTKYELLLNDFYVSLLNNKIMLFDGITFSEMKFYGKMLLDHQGVNGSMPKISLEVNIQKDKKKVFQYLLTTIETSYKLDIFFPYLFQNILSMAQEHIEITQEHVVHENKRIITTLSNLTNKKLIATFTPAKMSYELFDGEDLMVEYVSELTKIDVGTNSLVLEGSKIVQFNSYRPCFLPKVLCFNKLATKFHLEVVDKAEGKLKMNVRVLKDTVEILNAVVDNMQSPQMIVLRSPVLPFEMRIDYDVSTKVMNFMINNKSYVLLKPNVENEIELIFDGVSVLKVALLPNGIEITTLTKRIQTIKTIVHWKSLSLFQNTLDIEILVGKVSHKTLLGWNVNILRKGFVDVKVIGSGTELLGDYEVFRHLNWNIVSLKNIDFEWTGKVMCTGLKVFKTPMVTEGKLLFKDYVVDMKMVEKLMDVPYTLIFKSHPLTVALLPFFQYP